MAEPTSSDPPLIVERSDGVVSAVMNRPEKKNAANGPMWNAMLELFQEVTRNPNDRVLVLTGAGGAFCSGADITDTTGVVGDNSNHPLFRMRFLADVVLALHRIPKPTIAKVRGIAAGAGMSLALGCDLVVCADGARFSEIFALRGLAVDGGSSWLLPRLVGLQRAKELAFFADIISADQAFNLGLVNRVLPDCELDSFVEEWSKRLAKGPPLALSLTKTLLNNSFAVSMDQALEDEARAQSVNLSSSDTAEALRAFVERREPRFEGR
ncbi:MAG: enoyl-CoA hydratase [Actinobacteria bacterium]|nr:enoyl-CoA hydratase [Actinomycetota bacterium]